MKEVFEELIENLGKALGIALKVDRKGHCILLVEEKIKIQIEKEQRGEGYLLGAMLGSLPPGKYREEVLKNSLKENHFYPKVGSLAYNVHNDQLVLFHFVKEKHVSANAFSEIFSSFAAKALSWKQALEKNEARPF